MIFDNFDSVSSGGEENLPDNVEEFVKFMKTQGLEEELATCMYEELQETKEDRHNVIFIASNGELSIKAIHVPESALGGTVGPVLFPTSRPMSIIAAFSRETIQLAIDVIENMEPGLAEECWMQLLQSMTEAITLEYETNPPTWEIGN
jgi:hypothetical protein